MNIQVFRFGGIIYIQLCWALDPTLGNRRQEKMIARKWLLRGCSFKKCTNLFTFWFSHLPRRLKAKMTLKQRCRLIGDIMGTSNPADQGEIFSSCTAWQLSSSKWIQNLSIFHPLPLSWLPKEGSLGHEQNGDEEWSDTQWIMTEWLHQWTREE